MTKERVEKSVEILEYAILNNMSLSGACIAFNYADTYVKNTKIDIIEQMKKGTIDDDLAELFISTYLKYSKGTKFPKRKKQKYDKFYTKSSIVNSLISVLDLSKFDLIIEPSAGDGVFIDFIDKYNYIALDIEPEDKQGRIIKQNWYDFNIDSDYNNILVIGNPPFGRQGSSASAFINKSIQLGVNTIAFILPRSFKKDTYKDKINPFYHLMNEIDIPDNSFLLNGKDYSVPCVFQIWTKMDHKRNIIKLAIHTKYFKFVKKSENPDFAFRRVGFYAGSIFDDYENKSFQSHYFIKNTNYIDLKTLKDTIKSLKWEHNNTSGPRSIGKKELINEFEKKLKMIQ